MDIIVYHNPDCGTSRNTLALIRHAGIEPHVIEYLKTPPTPAMLLQLASRIGWPLRNLLRERGTPFKELGLDDSTLDDAALLAAVAEHPILLNRPIVVTPLGVKLCRPSETVLDLLPVLPNVDLDKDDGSPFLRDEQVAASDPRLAKALREVGLPTDDLRSSAGRFYSYRTLSGTLVGYAGIEMSGEDALLRSLLVVPAARGAGIGRNIVLLLMSRAFDAGGRKAWALTTSAAAFFERLGFAVGPSDAAPEGLAQTPQFASLCPSTAPLLTRRILL
ncbi:arsenate reductase [Ancylobacter novellus DSM 506]|uniref:Arsenate reductase n=1 Tax=Ancylobacter novellus (strain ATCC 8093 / DSM 506 / JCM 20403 / CCM 1077 / IAM 12100 / NBRC 12443 / NCIMB 10456) TaxID=639283 RepID=D7A9W9_ANCN5|nr:arsenate reductase (glutaredoxin) [Ancylobacter novellus]ADH88895.1 arsenate reductase [Ancylobacter novellus DSM 506]